MKIKSSSFDKNYYYGKVYTDYDNFFDYHKVARGLINHYSFQSFLDVGCGCGNLVKALKFELEKKYKKPCLVFGLDYSRFAVKKANASFVKLADCSKRIPFKPKQFDLVYVYTTLSYLPNLTSVKKAIKNIYRVAKKIIIFDDVYTRKMSLHDNNYDPCRVRILSKGEWIKLWRAAIKKGERIKISGDKIIITKK